MAMQSGNGEKMKQQQWFQGHQMDERDGFILWLRGEFAAANAIIDALCHHLRLVGEQGEYDGVIGCVQQRRSNWNSVLHMQQYFSVAEVIHSLHQVEWRRQQKGVDATGVKVRKEYRRNGKQGQALSTKSNRTDKIDLVEDQEADSSVKISGCVEAGGQKSEVDKTDNKCDSISKGSFNEENESHSIQLSDEMQYVTIIPKTFAAAEIYDGKTVNVVEGMKLYDELISNSEVSKLVPLVNDLRAAGRRGQLPGRTFVVSKRPMKGHGREMIQLGLPIADVPCEDEAAEQKVEAIPRLLQDIVERLSAMNVLSAKPDACIIDIFNEGDYSQPNMWPQWFGRPISVLFLSVCEMTFGKVIGVDHPGDYRGSIMLSLAPGSILVMEGRSADFARHAIPSLQKQRILVTLTKSQPRKVAASDGQRFSSSVGTWVPPPSRSPNDIHHQLGNKPYGSVPTTGVLTAPTVCSQLAPPNGNPQNFVPAPVAQPVPFPAQVALAPASSGWAAAPTRQPRPRLPLPGTGVFLPPSGSGTSSNQSGSSTPATGSILVETSPPLSDKDNIPGTLDETTASSKGNMEGKVHTEECNGSIEASHGEKEKANGQKRAAVIC